MHKANQNVEQILEPERPICDPHHHLWDHPHAPYLLEHLLEDTGSGHNIVSTVFVECLSMFREHGPEALRPLGETEFVNGIAAMMSSGNYGEIRGCAGIVSFADLLLGADVGGVLDEHIKLSSRFRGVRHSAAFDTSSAIRVSHVAPPQHMLLREDFREGFAELEKRKLSFDAWLYHPQIPELTELANAFPNTAIVLDHFGGPLGIGPYENKQEAVFEQWKLAIQALSKCPNVVAKLGGILMPINGFKGFSEKLGSNQIVEVSGRYYHHTIACFGPERCMFESNFPVDKRNCSYANLWNAFKKMASEYSSRDQDLLLHDTASNFYRLEESP